MIRYLYRRMKVRYPGPPTTDPAAMRGLEEKAERARRSAPPLQQTPKKLKPSYL